MEAGSRRISGKLFSLPEYAGAKTIMFYASFKNEVMTDAMIEYALSDKKKVVLPAVRGRDLKLYEVNPPGCRLVKGELGIREPRGCGTEVDPGSVDLVVVPGVAFDRACGRIGFGRGFYDRFLGGLKKPGKKPAFIGIAFGVQIAEELFLGEKDVRMDKVITENEIISP